MQKLSTNLFLGSFYKKYWKCPIIEFWKKENLPQFVFTFVSRIWQILGTTFFFVRNRTFRRVYDGDKNKNNLIGEKVCQDHKLKCAFLKSKAQWNFCTDDAISLWKTRAAWHLLENVIIGVKIVRDTLKITMFL